MQVKNNVSEEAINWIFSTEIDIIWLNYLVSLCLTFVICEVEMIILLPHWDTVRIK